MRKTLWIGWIVLTGVGFAGAMGRTMKDTDDAEFNARAEGARPTAHLTEVTTEQKSESLPAQPEDVESHAAKDFHSPFFKKSELAKDTTPGAK